MAEIVKRMSKAALAVTAILAGLTYVINWILAAVGPAALILVIASGPGSFLFPLLQGQKYEPRVDVFLGLYAISLIVALLSWELLRTRPVVRFICLATVWLAAGGYGLFLLAYFE